MAAATSLAPISDGGVVEVAQDCLFRVRLTYDSYIQGAGFDGFRQKVYPSPAKLVLAYVV